MLHNRFSQEELILRLEKEEFVRKTLSFYRYVRIENPKEFRDHLFKKFSELNILGRIYLASEGINAQMSIPEHFLQSFLIWLNSIDELRDIPIKYAIEDNGKSFIKLIVKHRNKIVADGLNIEAFDVSNVGKHLTANEFNQYMDLPETIVVDMRNNYESEVGHFEGAFCPDAVTFREELELVQEKLKDKKDRKILLYCTGGIRCEKASAYLKHKGFSDVNQLLGGIIDYYRQIEAENLPNRFKGKNFVFDQRMGERVTGHVIAKCHQCGNPFDTHVNCANDLCHLLFIQCNDCKHKYSGCCSEDCIKGLENKNNLTPIPFKGKKYRRYSGEILTLYRDEN